MPTVWVITSATLRVKMADAMRCRFYGEQRVAVRSMSSWVPNARHLDGADLPTSSLPSKSKPQGSDLWPQPRRLQAL